MSLHTYVQQLSQEINHSRPYPEKQSNRYLISLGDKIDVLLAEIRESENIYFFGLVGAVPKEGIEEIFLRLMEANTFGEGTADCVLALDEKKEMITLSKVLWKEHSYRNFYQDLEDFANILDLWREELSVSSGDWQPQSFFPSNLASLTF